MAQSRKPDLTKISFEEYLHLFSSEIKPEGEREIVAKTYGFETPEAMTKAINPLEYKRMIQDMIKAFRAPIENDEKN